MNSLNHFLTPLIVLLIFFKENSLTEIMIFSLIFGVLIDLDQLIGKLLKKPVHHRSTWIEEPFGLLFIGIPVGLLLSLVDKSYFFLVTIPYLSHIILDYLTTHHQSPLAPFSKKEIKLKGFKAYPHPPWYTGKEKGISENYFTILMIIILLVILL